MIIKIENRKTYENYNQSFNIETRATIEEIFETETLGKIGYLLSNLTDYRNGGKKYPKQQTFISGKIIRPDYKSEVKFYQRFEELGPLEASFIRYILGIEYSVILLTGALGSGKSSLTKYCLDLIEKNIGNDKYKDYINIFPIHGKIIRIDFNEVFYEQDSKALMNEFQLLLIDRLTGALTQLLEDCNFIDDFISHIKQNYRNTGWESSFRKFIHKWNQQFEKKCKDEDDKLEALLTWITDNEQSSIAYKLRLLTYIYKYLKKFYFDSKNVDFIILFDNIDKFPDDSQVNILNMIFSLYYKSGMKVILPVRLTTFGKIKGNGSYSFGVFSNKSASPIRTIRARIEHFIKNPEQYIKTSEINHLIKKLKFINTNLKYKENRLKTSLHSFAGNSHRRGLYLSERMLINNVVAYDEENPKIDHLIRSLIVSTNSECLINNNDRLISNILILPESGQNSLISIRILQILDYYVINNIYECTLQVLLSQLETIGGWEESSILHAINYLLEYSKRLIFIEGVREYSDIRNLYQSVNDKVYITITGRLYLRYLMNDLEYIQSCFFKTNWTISKRFLNSDYFLPFIDNTIANLDSNKSKYRYNLSSRSILEYLKSLVEYKKYRISDHLSPAIDYSLTSERMRLVRDGLFIFFINDLGQISKYHDYNLNDLEQGPTKYIEDMFFANVFGNISISVIKILSHNDELERQEILSWYSQLLVIDSIYETIFDNKNPILKHSIKLYEMKLKYGRF